MLLAALPYLKPMRALSTWLHRWSDRVGSPARIVGVAGRAVVLGGSLFAGVLWGTHSFGAFETFELKIFDHWKNLRPDASVDERMLIVAITETDLRRYGWPVSDQTLAQAIAQLQVHQPAVIGLDLYRDIPRPPGTLVLNTQLQAENLIAITNIVGEIPAPLGVPASRTGFNDLTLDTDAVLRRNLLFVAGQTDYYSFALKVSLAYLANQGISFRYDSDSLFLGDHKIPILAPEDGGYQIADARGYQTLLNYRNRQAPAPTITLSQLLNGGISPDQVRDRIVLIGTVAASLKDHVSTPYSVYQANQFQMPGVVIHAQMTSQLLDVASGQSGLFRFWPQWSEALWLWGWVIAGGAIAWRLHHPIAFGLASLLGIGIIGIIGWLLFYSFVWIPVALPMVGFVGAIGVGITLRLFFTTYRDPLSGLLNRAAFVLRVQRSLSLTALSSHQRTYGVLVLGIDRFHLIQHSLSNSLSDRLLLQIAARIQSRLPRIALLARITANEFAIGLVSSHPHVITALADQLQADLAKPFAVGPHSSVVVPTRIGIALTRGEHIYTSETLLRDARIAMYRAKTLGQTRYNVFSAGMRQDEIYQFTLEADLRRAIAAQEFVLHYQPIISLQTGEVSGFEALIRWPHAQQGFISPQHFIPLAEETGLILPLGEWVCQAACQQAVAWRQRYPTRSLTLGINLSARQFEQPNFTQQLAAIIQLSNVHQFTLKFEITESMVMGDVEAAIDTMLQLKAMGCKLSLDDFGTGYSSLSHLQRFPIDTLKIDRSFIHAMNGRVEAREIVRTIIALGHSLGMDVVAEGVETPEQATILRSLNCEWGQGYFWSKPLAASEATQLLK
ncbi:putative bifunctional diguanylate cyclase/phosphodiesterase [Leptolyngbya sp. AN02str]|uniref:putative bifunctional diguanylate cyclase/phosphodiesterase n=1 Tax=Leptolyngbya sp. AN02str TaxID=3423363 RepID=UPI003D310088